eukprot:735887-Amphidinium_carterae.4
MPCSCLVHSGRATSAYTCVSNFGTEHRASALRLVGGLNLLLVLALPSHGGLEECGNRSECSHRCASQVWLDEEWLTLNSPVPSQGCYQGCYVDDYFQGVVIPGEKHHAVRHRQDMLDLSQTKLDRVRKEYDTAGLIVKESKSQLHTTKAVVWGGELDSERRCLSGSRDKLKRLVYVTSKLLRSKRRVVQAKLLERIIGQWVHQLLFQRVGMAFIDDLYKVLHARRTQRRFVVLSKGAVDELSMLLCLWPLFTADLGRPVSSLVTASDATLSRGGAVVGRVTPQEAVWIWHRLPRTRRPGSISWMQDTNELGVLEPAVPDEMMEEFLNSHQLRVILNYKFRYMQHINNVTYRRQLLCVPC